MLYSGKFCIAKLTAELIAELIKMLYLDKTYSSASSAGDLEITSILVYNSYYPKSIIIGVL